MQTASFLHFTFKDNYFFFFFFLKTEMNGPNGCQLRLNPCLTSHINETLLPDKSYLGKGSACKNHMHKPEAQHHLQTERLTCRVGKRPRHRRSPSGSGAMLCYFILPSSPLCSSERDLGLECGWQGPPSLLNHRSYEHKPVTSALGPQTPVC